MAELEEEETNGMDLLLDWLSPDREVAADLYLKLWQSLVYHLRRNFDDAESLASEAIQRTTEKLKEGAIDCQGGKARSYVYGVANLIAKEEFRKKPPAQWNEEIGESPTDVGEGFPEELYQILEECIGKLPYDDQQLLLEYIYIPKGVSSKQYRIHLADKWKINIGTLRVKILRLKKGLRECAKKRKKELE